MNDLAQMQVSEAPLTSIVGLLFNPGAMQALITFGDMMARSAVTIPKHLQGKPADCTAIAMQAAQWRMNPFAVAQKTHMSQSGALGYEAQLVNAVIVNSGAIEGRPEFEFLGDWDKILGRVEERTGQSGGKYYVAAWDKKDEAGLGVEVTCTISGERQPRVIRVMLSQAFPRFSTQWATDPQQQITYLAVRKFARRYVPDAILGVYTTDELAGEVFDVDAATGEATPAPKPEFSVRSKPKPIDGEVVDVKPSTDKKPSDAPKPETKTPNPPAPNQPTEASATSQKLVGDGEIAYLKKKAETVGADLPKILERMGGLVLEKLTKGDFDKIKSELVGMD